AACPRCASVRGEEERSDSYSERSLRRREHWEGPRWAETSSSRCFELDRRRSGGTAG
ncbi:hypothetical protein KI387_013154, partial [Taxus chinensis]